MIFRKTIRYLLALVTVSSFTTISCNHSSNDKSPATKDSSTVKTTDPLPLWSDGENKKAIIDFVTSIIAQGNSSFIKPEDRIATFDNDGTLWCEQPLYFQFFYSFNRIKQMAPEHPEWKTKEPFKSVLNGDIKKALASGEEGLIAIMSTTYTGMSADAFNTSVQQWADTAMHPITKKRYIDMTYQPMLELLNYLRANGFKTFIVSGGDIDFMRAWTEKVYGIPPQQVVGSSFKAGYDSTGIKRLSQFDFMDDGPGKPVGIYLHIGKKPVFAAGNSDGDYQMLQFTSGNTLPHMEIIVHHTDSSREYAYDRGSPIGKLDKGLNDANKYGWKLIDMKNDWKKIFPGD